MNKFFSLGFNERSRRHLEQLEKQRKAEKESKKENERKLKALAEKTEIEVDWMFTRDDRASALDKITGAAAKYDKFHPAAPNLSCFQGIALCTHRCVRCIVLSVISRRFIQCVLVLMIGGVLTPGIFRESLRRTLNVWLTAKELGSLIRMFSADESDEYCEKVDPKKFMIEFSRLGTHERQRVKAAFLHEKKKAATEEAHEKARKLRLQQQKMVVDVDDTYGAVDRTSAISKLTAAR